MTSDTSLTQAQLNTLAKELGSTLEQQWSQFSQKILALHTTLGLTNLTLICDHVALRVNAREHADALTLYFADKGQIISNNRINGRPILIIELNSPMQLGPWSIDCVELPYPSDKHYASEGWEHIELVLPSAAQDCDQLMHDLLLQAPQLSQRLAAKDTNQNKIQVKLSSPKGDKERLPNPTIAFKVDDTCIKLHPHGIKAVIASEQID